MFDIGWSELLILGVIALIVVGPKDLPVLLRTLGKYLGVIRRQASEFRTQFDEALRETELDQIRKDMAGIKQDVTSTMHGAARQVERDLDAGKIDASAKATLEKKTASGELAGSVDAASSASSEAADDDWVQATFDDPGPPKKAEPVAVESAAVEPVARAARGAEKSGV
ncbi:MAG: Sec-independent protein translocase protein TatB [Alphaproteobacteria bacterium]|nr:Sec-independent protein translocase protein TatB [Alphaproteobacteria bacterium]